ncbi:MAG: hypothetical protein J6F33_12535, partial [Acidaminococcaceae bacterium]|nr:hypothetical protein [Acidaminococcaceae bacterium]
ANRTSGAVGLPNLIPYMWYFWNKDMKEHYMGIGEEYGKYYAKQGFQRFIYAVNQPYVRDGSQSAFTNTSVFDRPYFEALFGGSEFPDGSFMIDAEEEIIEFQKWYMESMAEIRSENMFTFPVSTISLLRQEQGYRVPGGKIEYFRREKCDPDGKYSRKGQRQHCPGRQERNDPDRHHPQRRQGG